MDERIDVIVPAHRAHETIGRTLESLAAQSIAGDLDVVVVDDECPEGDYREAVAPFLSRLDIRLIRLPQNLGPGGARQAGIDASDSPYFTCIDADDAFSTPCSLELLRNAISENDAVQRCGGCLATLDETGVVRRHSSGGVSMDGKLYRRSFIDRYGLRFNGTRANEDFGYNMAVDMLCDNDDEQTRSVPETVVDVHTNIRSITASGDRQFAWDQRLCGLVDNAIWAIGIAKQYRPHSEEASRQVLRVLLITYCLWNIIAANAPEYSAQAWEYAKKYYHRCYRRWYIPAFASMEERLKPETTKNIFEVFAEHRFFSLPEDFEPVISFDEFLRRMKTEEYDPGHIYDVWAKMAESPEMRARMKLNEETGVCARGYTERKNEQDV